MSLTEVFPVEPVMPTTFGSSSQRHSRASAWSAASGSEVENTHPKRPSRAAARACCGRQTTPHAPSAERAGRELAAVRVLAGKAEEEVARGNLARVDDRALGPALRAFGENLEAGRVGDPLGRKVDHAARPAPSASSSARATSRSSNGIFRPPSNSWPCSWPLPAITTVSPSAGELERPADRVAAVHLDPHVVAAGHARA